MSPTRSLTRIAATALVIATLLGARFPSAGASHGPRAVVPAVTKTKNLIKNPGAEAGNGSSNGSIVHVPNWSHNEGHAATAVRYGASGGFPDSNTPGPPSRGHNFFAGGPSASVQGFQQDINASGYRAAIDAGRAGFVLKAWLGGFQEGGDNASATVAFYDGGGHVLDFATIGPVTSAQRNNQTKFLLRSAGGQVPAGTRKVIVLIRFNYSDGSYNDAYADNLSLVLTGV
jgi:hypothetical protein